MNKDEERSKLLVLCEGAKYCCEKKLREAVGST